MPLFNWPDRSTCGDTPPDTCAPNPTAQAVKAPHGTSSDNGCVVDLISPDHPALLVSLNDMTSELRSGTAERPIPIDLCQSTASNAVPTLAFRNNLGQLSIWKPPVSCAGKKVIFDGGDFKLSDDVNSNVFDNSCIGSYEDVEYIVGARSFTDCEGRPKVKLVLFPVAELPAFS